MKKRTKQYFTAVTIAAMMVSSCWSKKSFEAEEQQAGCKVEG